MTVYPLCGISSNRLCILFPMRFQLVSLPGSYSESMIDMSDTVLACRLNKIETSPKSIQSGDRTLEFHVHAWLRKITGIDTALFMISGNLVIPDFTAARSMAQALRDLGSVRGQDTTTLSAGRLNAMGLVDEILHRVLQLYRQRIDPQALGRLMTAAGEAVGLQALDRLLQEFCTQFPPREVYSGAMSPEAWLAGSSAADSECPGVSNREIAFEEMILLKLANENPAFAPFRFLFDDGLRPLAEVPDSLAAKNLYAKVFAARDRKSREMPAFGPAGEASTPSTCSDASQEGPSLWDGAAALDQGTLGRPLRQRRRQDPLRPRLDRRGGKALFPGPGPAKAYSYVFSREEYEKFTQDRIDALLVLLAKTP